MSEATQRDAATEEMVRTLQVDVYSYREGDDVLFSHAWRRQGDSRRQKGQINIPFGERDVPIHFHLHDRSGLKLKFESTASDAMWVSDTECPTAAGNGGQINFDQSNPNLLKVSDTNSEACLLHFALRFTGDELNGSTSYEYDPEIRNGGGGII